MFRGFSNVSLDSKGRVAIPRRYRERLMEDAGGCLVQTLNIRDSSVFLYPLPDWKPVEKKLVKLPDKKKESRRAKQVMLSYATDCQLDAHGRVLLRAELRDEARIDRQAVILGQGNRFEIWNKAIWEEVRAHWLKQVSDEQGDTAATLQSLSL